MLVEIWIGWVLRKRLEAGQMAACWLVKGSPGSSFPLLEVMMRYPIPSLTLRMLYPFLSDFSRLIAAVPAGLRAIIASRASLGVAFLKLPLHPLCLLIATVLFVSFVLSPAIPQPFASFANLAQASIRTSRTPTKHDMTLSRGLLAIELTLACRFLR